MKVSVLMATKDRPEYARRAVEAVLAQEFVGDLEVIVKDGGSCPAPLPHDPRIFRVFGPDRSIAHAFNQAAALATGEVMHNINDDDVMLSGTIASAALALCDGVLAPTGPQWTYGKLMYQSERDGRTAVHHHDLMDVWPWDPEHMARENCVHQPTVFYTARAWAELGPFNENFRYAYDYEFWGRLGAHYEPVVRDHFDALYTFWPGSTSVATPQLVIDDADNIVKMWAEHGFGQRP